MVKVSEQKAHVVREFESESFSGRSVVFEITNSGYLIFHEKRYRTQYVVHLDSVFMRTVRSTIEAERANKKKRQTKGKQ